MTTTDYWQECLSTAADECGLTLTRDQLRFLAQAVEGAHENYDMAFYSPPSTDRIAVIESEWRAKYERLERQMQEYRQNVEEAVRRALNQHPDVGISIGEYGSVERYDGQVTQIQ